MQEWIEELKRLQAAGGFAAGVPTFAGNTWAVNSGVTTLAAPSGSVSYSANALVAR